MDKYKVTKVLDIFFHFNHVENSDSLMVFENEYNDDFFRWESDTFKHDKVLTAICNETEILIFSTEKVRERVVENFDKIKSNDTKTKFGCLRIVVKDLLLSIPFQELTDEDILQIDAQMEWMKTEVKRKAAIQAEVNKQRTAVEESRKGYAKI